LPAPRANEPAQKQFPRVFGAAGENHMSFASASAYIAALVFVGAASSGHAASKETVLYSFSGTGTNADGARPAAGLVAGPDGSLYGTTSDGGASICSCGTVFRLTPPAQGQTKWTETVVHSFQGYPNDGAAPFASLIFDQSGNLYGTTLIGGAAQSGTVFMIAGATGSNPTETTLYAFTGTATDGQLPFASLTLDANGALYGTTSFGGAADQGIIFKLQVAGGNSSLSVLHSFAGGSDGGQPFAGVTFDGSGNLYGTTSSDGMSGWSGGTVFQLTPGGTETVLHSFTDIIIGGPYDGGIPFGNLTLDASGNVYGTTLIGGHGNIEGEATNAGTVFELAPPSGQSSTWTETLLHSFSGPKDGSSPVGGVLFDTAGNLYGTTTSGGAEANGTVYELTPPAAGRKVWKQTTLKAFEEYPDGGSPNGTLIADEQGNLYGTTQFGTNSAKSYEVGTVFELAP
jgi:uncharacterized repeat protein (TIGR03803 family)